MADYLTFSLRKGFQKKEFKTFSAPFNIEHLACLDGAISHNCAIKNSEFQASIISESEQNILVFFIKIDVTNGIKTSSSTNP